ncbi:MAG: hypothetical protein HY067_05215 [Betaproteobacteria bacterium]|nr:hypothetical protein [Betaproteobacteria bacterium]
MAKASNALAKPSSALAKLSRPKLFGALPRQRLFDLLDQCRAHPLVWVAGPPGAGKTTLIASYLEARQLPGLWYQVDAGDVDPATFFYYLGLAASELTGDHQTLPLLTPEYLPDLPGFSRRFFRELYARLPRPAVVVLNNYEEVLGEVAFHSLLADSVQEIPEGVNVIVAGRSEPPARFARLVANKTVGIVGWEDLRLTPEETRGIACATHPMDEALLATLYQQSGGWAAGLTLMLERIRRNGIAPEHVLAETREAAFNYFAGEIFDKAPPEDQQILISTAFLPRVTAALAEQLSGSSNAGKLLNDLYRHQLFIDRRAGTEVTYQYHDLFRDFLLARAREFHSPVEFTQLARRAAQLLEANGQFEDAVGLYTGADDWNAAAELILKQAPGLLAQGRGQTLREWISALPAERVKAMPWLAYWHGRSLIQVDHPRARQILEQVFADFKERGDEIGQMVTASGIIETHHFEWAYIKPMDRWIDALDELLSRNPAFPSAEVELRVYSGLLMALLRRRPEHPLLPVCVQRVMTLAVTDLDANLRVSAVTVVLVLYWFNADWERAREARQLIESLLRHPDVAPLARVYSLVRYVHRLWLELHYAEAAAALDQAFEIAERHGLTGVRAELLHARNLLALAQGDRATMASTLQALNAVVNPQQRLDLSLMHRSRANYAMLLGNTAGAVEHARAAMALMDEVGVKPNQSLFRFYLAAALAADGKDEEALQYLEEARGLIRGSILEQSLRDHDLIEACIALKRGNRERCHALLSDAFDPARYSGTASFAFSFYPAFMAQLCAEALRAGIHTQYVNSLIRQYGLVPEARDIEEWPWPIKIHTLGRFLVLKDDVEIRFARKTQRRPLDLLQALIALGGSDVAVSALTEALWPDAEGDAAYHAFENTLYRLRQLLGSANSLSLASGKLSLDSRRCWVDVWALERRLESARDGGAVSAQGLDIVMQLYRGHFLGQEAPQPWILPARERLRDKFLRYVESVAQSCERDQQWAQAAAIYQRGIELDHLAESLYRGLMICYRELGNHAEALKVYRRCRDLLSVVLGVQPTADTQAIYQSLKQT